MSGKSQQLKRDRARAAAAAAVDLDGYEPVIIRPREEEAELLHLFSVFDDKGEEQQFFIPRKVRFNVTLATTKILAERGEYAAGEHMIRTVLGDDAWDELIACDDLQEEDFERIMETARTVVLGPPERRGKGR
ncbi:hypothetical protein [Micromonospora sp. NBC_00421]|uniref:hypothetical protein n=1 Tax=Micromonospora sp. NBC_00421 TaxID=2975976 RepID=UPI002E23B7F6